MTETTGVDRRIVRTQESIQNALIELITEKGFDSISVSDISSRADINRGTFYLHYRDKFDLLEKTEDRVIEHMKNILLDSGRIDLQSYTSYDALIPVIIDLFTYIHEQNHLMKALLGLNANPGFQSRIKKAIETNLFNLGFFSRKSESDLLVPVEYLLAYMSAAHMGVVQTWLINGCRETPEEMARILIRMSFFGPFRAIRTDNEIVDDL